MLRQDVQERQITSTLDGGRCGAESTPWGKSERRMGKLFMAGATSYKDTGLLLTGCHHAYKSDATVSNCIV